MIGKKLWYLVTFAALMMFTMAGCSGGSSSVTVGEKGTLLKISGKVDAGKATAKTVGLTPAVNTVEVIDAQDGTSLGTAVIDAEGKFTGLSFNLASTKAILVFKATVSQGTFLNVTPIDLSNPPTGITSNDPINIEISEASTATARLTSQLLGLTGDLGDAGQTLNSLDPDGTYATTAQLVVENGGKQLAYGSNGIALSGKFSSSSLLPAVNAATLTADQLSALANSLKVTVTKVAIPGNSPIVSFQVTNAAGKGVIGLKNTFDRFAIATLVPSADGAQDEWLNYMLRTSGTALGWPDAERRTAAGYATRMIDNGDGSYTYIFAKDIKNVASVPYVNTQTHRVGFVINGTPLGAEAAMVRSLPPVHDFVPAGGIPDVTRDIATAAACNQCHTDLSSLIGHTASRGDVRFCVMCHTKQSGSAFADTASVNGVFDVNTQIQKADGELLGDFPVMIHKIHMGSKLTKTGYNFFNIKFNAFEMPNDIRNCRQCHKGDTAAELALSQDGDNWRTKPSRKSCGSCHDNINFATGKFYTTGLDAHSVQTSDANCASCHGNADLYHTANLATTADASKRTMSSTITGVTVDAVTGKVTATFTVSDGGVAVTDITKFTKPSFSLVKLVPAANGSSDWVSYTGRFTTKNAAMAPVLQGRNENAGTLVANADGSFSYTFKLVTAEPEGDIRNVTHAHNAATVAGDYHSVTGLPQWLAAANIANVVTYEPTLTHRVAMGFQKVGTPNVDNATNAYFDFVPAGGAVTTTRNIVVMDNCKKCHAGNKLHAGYAIEYCVTCHNSSTFDPFTGETVDLQRVAHKLHMGKDLPSVIAGGSYKINGTHDYSALAYPGIIKNCAMCHVEGTGAPKNAANWYTKPTKAACNTCHDGVLSTLHIDGEIKGGVETCVTCHGSGKAFDIKSMHR